MNEISWDVAVIGGASAGLSAALMLGRARRRVIVIDAAAPRNRFAAHMHGLLGHDGRPPADLLADGRREVESYGGRIITATATRTRRDGDGFAVETADGEVVRARKLLVTTGARDELPDLDGLAERWGRGVAVCPYCDGYEVRDQRIGILATGPGSEFQAQLLRQWSPSISYLADAVGGPGGETRDAFDARGIHVEEGPVRRVVSRNDRIAGVEMADGRLIELDAIFTIPRLVPRDEPLRQLGAERTEHPWGSFVTVDENGQTSVDGVWAAGNVVNAMANVAVSIGAGALAAGAINHALVLDDIRRAVCAVAPAPAEPE
ncbi:NAD(P)/FAD-dependent oxidoreductase [Micromonospora musae]|uniref:NAD(P)/FAD-dependent oxidoreductase n=1 Tax=Micromonospora musae TaxID=1894970 RepID=A0ABX9RC29_9ACTN|nr:NAD(P)/FAD-dependent oxidoreductase [Micromonospora musae]RKN21144.1 NAD(P)/FAD-dependent oxidoreductase [Micromonospora musae]